MRKVVLLGLAAAVERAFRARDDMEVIASIPFTGAEPDAELWRVARVRDDLRLAVNAPAAQFEPELFPVRPVDFSCVEALEDRPRNRAERRSLRRRLPRHAA